MFYSKSFIQHGSAEIKGKPFNYSFINDKFDFVPTKDLTDDESFKSLSWQDLEDLTIECKPFAEKNMVATIIGTENTYISYEKNISFRFKRLFIHSNSFSIKALEFSGPTINQIVQNRTMREMLMQGARLPINAFHESFTLFDKKCELTTITDLRPEREGTELTYKSSIWLQFHSEISVKEAFDCYQAFIRLIQFMAHRKDVFFECATYDIRGNRIYPNGRLFLPLISEKDIDIQTNVISFESISPIVGGLLQYALDGNIVPLFIPEKKTQTISDSFILATSWAQMLFKQVYVPLDTNYYLDQKKYYVYDKRKTKNKKVSQYEQLKIMIDDTFSYISDFYAVSIPLMLKGYEDCISKDLPERLKNVRNAIAHGSSNLSDYNYEPLDMTVLLCCIYQSILRKKFGLDDKHLKLALSELLFGDMQAFMQWKELQKSDEELKKDSDNKN